MLMFGIVLAICGLTAVVGQKSQLMPDYFDHPCVRPCEDNADPMECQYRFVVESYETMSRACFDCAAGNVTDCSRQHCVTANGFPRNIKTVNRGIPGPTIQVCEGDTIIVDLVNNYLMSEGVTIHWHGILQRFSPYMDGVGMITQCPIQASTSFQYKFVVIDPGTHFWHAHTGLQRGEGVFGSLVVRQSPSREPHIEEYDFDLPEHVIIVNEWQNKPLIDVYTAAHHSNGRQSADAILINGRATDSTGELELPQNVFQVEPGQRYRFRIINSGSLFCPIEISVDNHNLTLIASDGRPFETLVVQSFDTFSAERYDFIITADQPPDNYFFRARGLGTCQANNLEELAILQYLSPQVPVLKDVRLNKTARPEITGVLFNSIPVDEKQPLGDTQDQILGMNALAPDDRSLTGEPDHQFILNFQFRQVNNLHYFDPDLYPGGAGGLSSAQINRISNRLGPVSLLGQMDEVPPELFCNDTSVGESCENEWCECVHRLTVQQDDIVEIVLITPSGAGFTHPLHLHGFSFRVVGMARVDEVLSPELFREMDARGDIQRKLSRAPFKDTVPIPNSGWVIMRFVADNPGVWYAHCHLAFHTEIGMTFSLEVLGEDGKLPPRPPNFPTCGPFALPPEDAKRSQKTVDEPKTGSGNTLLTSGGSGTGPLGSPATEAAVPQWVLPIFISMGIVSLVMAVVQLWKKNKKAQSKERSIACPSYQAQGEIMRDELPEGSEYFSYSKKQERIGLTH